MQSLEEMRGREQLPRCRGDIRLALPRQTASSFDIWIEAGASEPAWTVHTTISYVDQASTSQKLKSFQNKENLSKPE